VSEQRTQRGSAVSSAALYERLGGHAELGPAVEIFYRRVLDDAAVAGYFRGVDLPRLIAHQKAFLTTVLGGSSVFTGRQLRDVHQPLAITDEAFDAVVEHLIGTLRDLGTPAGLASEVQGELERFRVEVVRPRPARP
jgi:hemoglobin